MRVHVIRLVTLINAIAVTVAIIVFFTPYARRSWFDWLFFASALSNAISFLVLYRHSRRNEALTESQRNRWEIALFLVPMIAHPLYVWQFIGRQNGSAA